MLIVKNNGNKLILINTFRYNIIINLWMSENQMSEIQIKSQISLKEDQITRIEEDAAKKEALAEKEVNQEYDPKIASIESNLSSEQAKLDEATTRAAEWTAKRDELRAIVKNMTKEQKMLKSEKEKTLKTKTKTIENDKKSKINTIKKEIKPLNKQLALIQKAANQGE